MQHILVSRVLDEQDRHGLGLRFVSGKKGLSRKIRVPWIQKPGLALTGDTAHIEPGRVQFLGASELNYLQRLAPAKRRDALDGLLATELACVIISEGFQVPDVVVRVSRARNVTVLQSDLATPTFYDRFSRYLRNRLTQATTVHGVLVDVFGVGILITGKSGIGKSECALDLVMRGHRLVADDVVGIRLRPPSTVYGFSSELIKYHMEIRGLGIINVKDLFGVAAIREEKDIELVAELVAWEAQEEYDRLGIDESRYSILGTEVSLIRIPVTPGRNITSIIEVAARNQLMKLSGHHAARAFQKQLERTINEGGSAWAPGEDG